jgi:hypothetical protein
MSLEEAILDTVGRLPPAKQEAVLRFADGLQRSIAKKVPSRDRTEEIKWIAENRAAFADQWVAVEAGRLIAADIPPQRVLLGSDPHRARFPAQEQAAQLSDPAGHHPRHHTTLIAVTALIHGMNVYIADKVSNMGSDGFRMVRMAWFGPGIPRSSRNAEAQSADPPDEYEFVKSHATLFKDLGMMVSRQARVTLQRRIPEGVDIEGVTDNIPTINNVQVDSGRAPSPTKKSAATRRWPSSATISARASSPARPHRQDHRH